MGTLWSATSQSKWREAHDRYDDVIAAQGVSRLVELDRWYQRDLPPAIAKRRPARITHAELVKAAEWKMARGVFRARNLVLVKGNDAGVVEQTSIDALSRIPDPKAPIATLAKLDGVGPATASAIAAAAAPEIYPFFDELVAAQIPGLGPVAFTMTCYARYADALRSRAAELGERWTPVLVEKALWANSGGKAALRK